MGLWSWVKRSGRRQTPLEVRPARQIEVAGETFYLRKMRSVPDVERADDELRLRPEYFEMKVIPRQKVVTSGKRIWHDEDFN